MNRHVQKNRKALGLLGATMACVVALLYMKFVPAEAVIAVGVQRAILLYGHSLCWLLLGGASVLWGYGGKAVWVKVLIYSALTVYVAFIGALLYAT